eukprot:c11635_g1_i1 orf=559-1353(-)
MGVVVQISPLLPSSSAPQSIHGSRLCAPHAHYLSLFSYHSHLPNTDSIHKLPALFVTLPADHLSPCRLTFSGVRTKGSIPFFGCERIIPSVSAEFNNESLSSPVAGSVDGVEKAENFPKDDTPAVEGLAGRNSSTQVDLTVQEAIIRVGDFDGKGTMPPIKRKGAIIVDFLTVFGGLLDRPFGSGQMIAAAGGVVVERVNAEAVTLREGGEINEQAIFEFLRILRLLEMDLQLVHAARKDETLAERLEAAKTHCKQAILLADSF